MQNLRLRNVRCLEDTTAVPLRPLTVIVGRNGAGKSTFARWLPLLRQSVETPTAGPILWFGGLVDFGSASTAVRRGASDISFGFQLEPLAGGTRALRTQPYELHQFVIDVTLDPKTSRVRSVGVSRGDDEAVIFFDAEAITAVTVNGETFPGSIQAEAGALHTLPAVGGGPTGSPVWPSGGPSLRDSPLHKKLFSHLRAIPHGRTTDQKISAGLNTLRWAEAAQFKRQLLNLAEMPPSWQEGVRELDAVGLEAIRRLVIARDAVVMLGHIDARLRTESLGVGYIGPFRQVPDRYYRIQDLSIDAIDMAGRNLPMVLKALEEGQLADLSEWLKIGLGFGVEVSGQKDGPHVEVRVVDEAGNSVNLIDAGFGISQVLPVAVQLWKASKFPGRRPLRTLVMEQPELHLHPELQGRLGEVFAAVASGEREVGGEVKLLVETHSEPLLNAVGSAIALGRLDSRQVSVVLFDRDPVTGTTTLRQSEFDAAGRLSDWPVGFLSA